MHISNYTNNVYMYLFVYTQAPVLLLTMAYVTLYAYAQPYQIPHANLLAVVLLVDVLLLLMIISTKVNHYKRS